MSVSALGMMLELDAKVKTRGHMVSVPGNPGRGGSCPRGSGRVPEKVSERKKYGSEGVDAAPPVLILENPTVRHGAVDFQSSEAVGQRLAVDGTEEGHTGWCHWPVLGNLQVKGHGGLDGQIHSRGDLVIMHHNAARE